MTTEEKEKLKQQLIDKLSNLQYKSRVCMNPQGVLRYSDLIKQTREQLKALEA